MCFLAFPGDIKGEDGHFARTDLTGECMGAPRLGKRVFLVQLEGFMDCVCACVSLCLRS